MRNKASGVTGVSRSVLPAARPASAVGLRYVPSGRHRARDHSQEGAVSRAAPEPEARSGGSGPPAGPAGARRRRQSRYRRGSRDPRRGTTARLLHGVCACNGDSARALGASETTATVTAPRARAGATDDSHAAQSRRAQGARSDDIDCQPALLVPDGRLPGASGRPGPAVALTHWSASRSKTPRTP